MGGGLIFFAIVAVIVLVAIVKTAVIVPQKMGKEELLEDCTAQEY